MKSAPRVFALAILTLLSLPSLASAGSDAASNVRCQVKVDGTKAIRVEPSDSQAIAYVSENFLIEAIVPEGHENRLRLSVVNKRSGSAAYVIGGFHNGRLKISPEIHGQLLSVRCVQIQKIYLRGAAGNSQMNSEPKPS